MRLLLIACLLIPLASFAQGKQLHDQACVQCHASLMQGNANKMYTRADRKVSSLSQLEKRVSYCTLAADVTWDKSQQQAVVKYLSQTFYQF